MVDWIQIALALNQIVPVKVDKWRMFDFILIIQLVMRCGDGWSSD